MNDQIDILFQEIPDRQDKKLGVINLNRPKALNAVTFHMYIAMKSQLDAWQENSDIKAVLIKSNSDKAFCAGGDIRAVYQNRDKSVDELSVYFDLEYEINRMIYHFPKPYISFLDGITMGGGVGISINGSHPIVTENCRLAMPETLIGFFPDVGAAYHLSRLEKYMGFYLGLTGNTFTGNDALEIGLVKHHVLSRKLPALEQALIDAAFGPEDSKVVTDIIQSYSAPKGESELTNHIKEIKRCFKCKSVEEILESLQKRENDWCDSISKQLLQRSPTSLKVTFEYFNRAKKLSFNEISEMDFQLVKHFLSKPDFYEGIRAAIIDKDKKPNWDPKRLVDMSNHFVESYFKRT